MTTSEASSTVAGKAGVSVRGEAGRRGDDVRSDLYAALVPRSEGGVRVNLVSRVALYYGEAIRKQAEEVLRDLAIEHCELHLDDKGALPYVIAARIEAAARRAGLGRGLWSLPEGGAPPPPSAKDRLRRSRLYLPGSQPKFFINAGLHEPDGLILDLEDSVHPDEKDSARLVVRNALAAVDFGGAERMVRINQLPLGLEDLNDIVPLQPEMILIPKVETAGQVMEVERRVLSIQEGLDLDRPIWLMPIIESALGVENAHAIAFASEHVAALTLGLEDLTADLGVTKTREGDETLYARSRIAYAATAAGVQAIDSVYGDVGDAEGLAAWARRSRAMGFEGMGCVHPRQIPIIHEAFAPSRAEIDRALKIVRAFEKAEAKGLGVVSLGTKMVDPPVVNRALKLVAQARAMGLVDADQSEEA